MSQHEIGFVNDNKEYRICINGSKIYLYINNDNYQCEHNGINQVIIDECIVNGVRINQVNDNTLELKSEKNKVSLLFKKILFYTYVLELDEKKYYIGKSSKPMKRIGDHTGSEQGGQGKQGTRGSGWTQMYKPVKILEINSAFDPMEEDFTTLRYMNQMGIDNVRGGSFCELNLSPENTLTLEKMMRGADDKCYFCGSDKHLIISCDQKNIHRKTIKHKEKAIPKKDISKSKILKRYGAEQLLNNSDKKVTEIMKDHGTEINKIKCKFCKMIFQSTKKMVFHSEYQCPLNKKNQLTANIDKILEENSKYVL